MPSQTNLSNEELLLHLNNQIATTLIPAMLVIGVLMVMGLFGNGFVCFVFAKRLKPGTQNFMILCLASFDLLSCVIAMPAEIVDMRYYYLFDSEFVCKTFRFVNVLCSMCSIVTLTAIAIDRYIKVCRPLGRQMTLGEAKISVLASVFIGIFFAWPSIFIYGLRSADTGIPGVEGKDCSTSDDVKDTKYPLVYNFVLFVGFLGLTITFAVLYGKIYKEVQRHKKYMTKVAISTPSSPITSTSEFHYPSITSINSDIHDELPIRKSIANGNALLQLDINSQENGATSHNSKGDKTVTFKTDDGSESAVINDNELTVTTNGDANICASEGESRTHSSLHTKVRSIPPPLQLPPADEYCESDIGSSISACSTPKNKKNPRFSIGRETRTTVIAFLVTTVFVISYLPYLGLIFARIFNKDFDHDIRGSALAAYNLFLRSYFVNSAANPIIYGFLNFRFRQEVKRVFNKIKFWKRT
ncbi:hypothetical protein SNE40_021632 [Patella caerulea]|uniref:G-protein coupled receptors family 1 profile domain-containing protein n=2 Tax=Patella caerulea TaxID=87958 RepID=A0AAN8J0N4_PATCE